MTIQKVDVLNRRGLVALDGNLMDSVVLSIIDPWGSIPVIRECNWLLCLAFHDETNPFYGTVISDAQARCIAAYLMAVHAAPEVRKLIVQCEMGISRSGGIASAVCEHWNLPFENPEINGQPRYRPNPFVRQKVLTALLDVPSLKITPGLAGAYASSLVRFIIKLCNKIKITLQPKSFRRQVTYDSSTPLILS